MRHASLAGPNLSRRGFTALAAGATLSLFATGALSGCAQARIDNDSPRVASIDLSAASDMSEASQRIELRFGFDRAISVGSGALGDFSFKLNGSDVDASAIKLELRASAQAISFVLSPASSAAGVGSGSFFAVYQAGYSICAARGDNALPSIQGATGSAAVLDELFEGVLPSGLAIEVGEQREGSAAAGVLAQSVFTVTSPAKVRAITWFSPDGGQTKLLKHNHNFASASAADAAADLASVVNQAQGLGITAAARDTQVTLTATQPIDGQVIRPVIVEGPGVTGGVYDGSTGTGDAA